VNRLRSPCGATVSRVTETNPGTATRATELLRLHTDPDLLVVVNVWDAVSAAVVAAQPGCRAVATASHSIAATLGYPDGERIPVDLMIDMVGRIAAAVPLPVSADLEAGYGDPGETVRRAIGVGVVGANLEDRMHPLPEAVAAVEAAVAAGAAEGVPFVLNARTDVFLRAGDRDRAAVLADAVERGRAFLDAGAACVFVPGLLTEPDIRALVEGIGERRVSVINVPGSLPQWRLAELGVARVSFGPWIQRSTLTHLAGLAEQLLAGGALPDGVQVLN
jgi:2-methylisocitrate lyase-like PEP mutase family enzyme